jgi:hypothetical protein
MKEDLDEQIKIKKDVELREDQKDIWINRRAIKKVQRLRNDGNKTSEAMLS